MKKCTQSELKFLQLHRELINLKLYHLADRLSEVFYTHSSEMFESGLNEASNIYKKNI